MAEIDSSEKQAHHQNKNENDVNVEKPQRTGSSSSNGKRIVTLAKPKISKAIWATNYESKLVWGNQEPMWPLSAGALRAVPNERIEQMAKSKTNLQSNFPEKCARPEFQYSCGRSSVIWEVSSNAMKGGPSERIEVLARHKTLPPGYREDRPSNPLGCGRSSPIWEVSDKAKKAEERPATARLALPKKTHQNYIPCREVQWPVSAKSMRGEATSRTEYLSRPKDRHIDQYREPTWSVRTASLRAAATVRVQELAKPKLLPDGFISNRDVEWRIPRSALRSHTSERMKNLSQPIVRDSMDHVQFNPDAFKVTETAKRAKITMRISELAQPIQRGGRLKAS